jgi:hypothetical protein
MNKQVKPNELPLEPTATERTWVPKACFRPPEEDAFDWNEDADCIILHEQPATAVYHGKGGHVVIRQTNGLEEDVTIIIAPENATAFQEGLAAYLRSK